MCVRLPALARRLAGRYTIGMDRRGKKKLLVVSAAGLSEDPELSGIHFRQAESVLPALTCPVQASFRTASAPARHGMIANGLFRRDLGKVMFWEHSEKRYRAPLNSGSNRRPWWPAGGSGTTSAHAAGVSA